MTNSTPLNTPNTPSFVELQKPAYQLEKLHRREKLFQWDELDEHQKLLVIDTHARLRDLTGRDKKKMHRIYHERRPDVIFRYGLIRRSRITRIRVTNRSYNEMKWHLDKLIYGKR